MNKWIMILISVMIAVTVMGSIALSISQRSATQTYDDTFAKPNTKTANYTLEGYHYVSLVSIQNNTGGTIPASNYSITTSDGANILLLTNKTTGWKGSSATIIYKADVEGKLTGASSLLLALVALIIVAGLIMMVYKSAIGKGK